MKFFSSVHLLPIDLWHLTVSNPVLHFGYSLHLTKGIWAMKKLLAVSIVTSAMMASPVFAGEVENCVLAVNAAKEGDLVKLESLETNGKDVYAIELVDANDQEWEFTCDAATGKIIQQDGEVEDAGAKAFAELAKIDEKRRQRLF